MFKEYEVVVVESFSLITVLTAWFVLCSVVQSVLYKMYHPHNENTFYCAYIKVYG